MVNYAQTTQLPEKAKITRPSNEPVPEAQPNASDLSQEPEPLVQRKTVDTDVIKSPATRVIEHPNAERGLIKIDKNRNYIYRTPESDQRYGASLRIGSFDPTELANPDLPDVDFSSVYTESDVPMLHYEMEKQFFKGFGRLAYTFGAGFYFARGTGKYANNSINPLEPPLEEFSLFVFPLSAGLQYRFQFWDTQMFVPYAGGGGDLFTFMEYRDDDAGTDLGVAFGAAPAAHFNAGLAVRMGRGARAFLDLDREYGINSISLVAEYRRFIGLSENYDFSSDFYGGGIFAEY